MEAKDFYRLRNGKGFLPAVSRALTFTYNHVRPPHPYPGRNQQVKFYEKYLDRRGAVLILGSALAPSETAKFRATKVVQMNITAIPNVDVVADAEVMSETFGESSFEYVVSTSMLEHTLHPWRVIAESYKVLKPGGIFYVGVPWMFPLHGEPHDYYRFSLNGIRQLMLDAGFEEVESGSETGPHAAFHLLLRSYLAETLSGNSSMRYYALTYLLDWLLFPLGAVERVFEPKPRKHHYTDSLVYFVGRKPLAQRATTD